MQLVTQVGRVDKHRPNGIQFCCESASPALYFGAYLDGALRRWKIGRCRSAGNISVACRVNRDGDTLLKVSTSKTGGVDKLCASGVQLRHESIRKRPIVRVIAVTNTLKRPWGGREVA